MALFDFQCPHCGRVEPDVRVSPGTAVDVWCMRCPEYLERDVRMYRQLGVPAPAIFTSGGTGASHGGE